MKKINWLDQSLLLCPANTFVHSMKEFMYDPMRKLFQLANE
jgi:hypothetical protein